MKTKPAIWPAGRTRRRPGQFSRCGWRTEAAVALLGVTAAWLVGATITRAGELKQFFYVPLSGATVADLTGAPEFPEQPFTVTPVNWFHTGLEGITNASTAYGSWLRGYLEAPVSGDYVFYLSADGSAELLLSTDHQADNKQFIARVEYPFPDGVQAGRSRRRMLLR